MTARNPNERRRLSPFVAGVIALAIIAIAVYLSAARRLPWEGDYEIKAQVTQANELGTRSPVRIAGVEVGKVKSVERGPGRTAIVTMRIDEDALPLHKDATLKVRPRIFLEGNFFVDLHPGTPGAAKMEEGDTIPLASTDTPVQLDQVLSGLRTDTREHLQTLVREFSRALDKGGAQAINRGFKPSAEAFPQIALISQAIRGRREGDLPAFIRDAGKTAAAVASAEALPELITGFNRSARALASAQAETSASLRELDSTLAATRPALDSLNRAFPPTRGLVREIRPGLRAAPETLRLANPLLAQLQGLFSRAELPALIKRLDPSLVVLARLEPRLVNLFKEVTPVTECLRINGVPTLKKSVDDDHLSTGAPVYRELLYGLVGLSSATQNFDGNGLSTRYHAGFGDNIVSFGNLPGTTGPVVGLTSEPIVGSRPKPPAERPPFRPDVPCTTQQLPNLVADTGPAPAQRSVSVKPRPLSKLDLSHKEINKQLGLDPPPRLKKPEAALPDPRTKGAAR